MFWLPYLNESDEYFLEQMHENDEELHAWCILDQSENEQRQDVISKQSRIKPKKEAYISLLIVENSKFKLQENH